MVRDKFDPEDDDTKKGEITKNMAVSLYLATYFPLTVEKDKKLIDDYSLRYQEFDTFADNFYAREGDLATYKSYKHETNPNFQDFPYFKNQLLKAESGNKKAL